MAFSPVVIPAVPNGVVEFTTNEGITELYDILDECEVSISVVSVQRKEKGAWKEVSPDSSGNYRSYVEYKSGGGIAEWIGITVEVADNGAHGVLWVMYDIDDPADHFDVDPNDTLLRPDGTVVGWGEIGGDNTGRNGPKFFQLKPYPFRRRGGLVRRVTPVSNPRFPVRELFDFTGMGAVTGIQDGKSGVIFQPTNDGGDNFKIYAVPVIAVYAVDGYELKPLCCGISIPIVVWRKFKVKVYAMDDPEDDNFFPGKDKSSLTDSLVKAFGDVNDPDRNCYIEMDVIIEEKNLHTHYVETVHNLHDYTLEHTCYHDDGEHDKDKVKGKHPLDTAQLCGIWAMWVMIRRGERYGATGPYPHSFLLNSEFAPGSRFDLSSVLVPYRNELRGGPYRGLRDGAEFTIEIRKGNSTVKLEVTIIDFDGDNLISTKDFVLSLRTATTTWVGQPWEEAAVTDRILKEIEGRRWEAVIIRFKGDSIYIKAEGKDAQALKRIGFPVNETIDVGMFKNHTAVHEVGHNLYAYSKEGYNGVEVGIDGGAKICKNYHLQRTSYEEPSASLEAGSYWVKFAPLIARDFRCTIFRHYDKDGRAYRD